MQGCRNAGNVVNVAKGGLFFSYAEFASKRQAGLTTRMAVTQAAPRTSPSPKTYISTGDDYVATKGTGTVVQHMNVLDDHVCFGHGMPIGSETFAGVSDLFVRPLSIRGRRSPHRAAFGHRHGK